MDCGCGTESMHSNESQLIIVTLISYRSAGVPQGDIIGPLATKCPVENCEYI